MFGNHKIGAKLMGSFLVVAILMAATALIGLTNIKSIADRSNVMYKKNTIAIEERGSIIANLEKKRGDIYRYIAVPADNYVYAARVKTLVAIYALNDVNRKKTELTNAVNNKSALFASGVLQVTTILTMAAVVVLALNLVLTLSPGNPLRQEAGMFQELGKSYLSPCQNMKRNDEAEVFVNTMDQYSDNLQKYVVKGM